MCGRSMVAARGNFQALLLITMDSPTTIFGSLVSKLMAKPLLTSSHASLCETHFLQRHGSAALRGLVKHECRRWSESFTFAGRLSFFSFSNLNLQPGLQNFDPLDFHLGSSPLQYKHIRTE